MQISFNCRRMAVVLGLGLALAACGQDHKADATPEAVGVSQVRDLRYEGDPMDAGQPELDGATVAGDSATDGRTDGRTDGPTDGPSAPTSSDAGLHDPDAGPEVPDGAPFDRDAGEAAGDTGTLIDAERPPADARPPEPDGPGPLPFEDPLTGSWVLEVENGGETFVAFFALTEDLGDLSGTAIDGFGLSRVDGLRDAGAVLLVKTYTAGPSEGGVFTYFGPLQADGSLAGDWSEDLAPENAGTFVARNTRNVPAPGVVGDWSLAADFGAAQAHLEVDPAGHLTGTMTDAFGAASLDGVFDTGGGGLWFRKLYQDGDMDDFWYVGVLEGATLEQGAYAAEADGEVLGVWRADRP